MGDNLDSDAGWWKDVRPAIRRLDVGEGGHDPRKAIRPQMNATQCETPQEEQRQTLMKLRVFFPSAAIRSLFAFIRGKKDPSGPSYAPPID